MDLSELIYVGRRGMKLTREHAQWQASELVVLNLQVQSDGSNYSCD
jgi:hypothetical protein